MTRPDAIRNISVIAHIDHGKSTLADRILEYCDAVDPREMRAQYLDSMDIERERGITIKAQNVRLEYEGNVINLIDTPGHVDFGYEVSRSLAACEGVILLVDASQGIEAQTLANCYLAVEHDLTIVAALNKIDLPAAEPDRVAAEIEHVLGLPAADILRISAKTGEGVPELLDAVVERVPPPKGDPDAPLQALIFDSYYDPYRGVVSAVRVMNGTLTTGSRLKFVQVNTTHDAEEIGVRRPQRRVPGPHHRGEGRAGRQPVVDAAAQQARLHRRALRQGDDHHPHRVRRRADGAVPGPAGRHDQHGVPVREPGRARLRAAAGRDRGRLLRPDEVPHPGLRLPRLRAGRRSPFGARQGRRPPQ